MNNAQPWILRSEIVKGFQRGGTQLGFPTANLQLNDTIISQLSQHLNTVWCGFCLIEGDEIIEGSDIEGLAKSVDVKDPVQKLFPQAAAAAVAETDFSSLSSSSVPPPPSSTPPSAPRALVPTKIYPTVLSVGTNPHFKNVALTVEPYIMHKYKKDFYGKTLRLIAVRPMRTMGAFTSLEALKAEIWNDCFVGSKILDSDVGARLKEALIDPALFVDSSSEQHPYTLAPLPLFKILQASSRHERFGVSAHV